MTALEKIYLYRITHIENMAHILEYGITHRDSVNANSDFVSIGDPSLINTRNDFILDNGRGIGDYIPFYFCTRSPMLYVIQKGFNSVIQRPAEDIIYCVTSVKKIVDTELDFVFTDGHAVDHLSFQFSATDIQDINDIIDWNAVKAKYWKDENDLDLKRRKEAEFLVLGDVPVKAILGYVVYSEETKERLLKLGVIDRKIHIKRNFYF